MSLPPTKQQRLCFFSSLKQGLPFLVGHTTYKTLPPSFDEYAYKLILGFGSNSGVRLNKDVGGIIIKFIEDEIKSVWFGFKYQIEQALRWSDDGFTVCSDDGTKPVLNCSFHQTKNFKSLTGFGSCCNLLLTPYNENATMNIRFKSTNTPKSQRCRQYTFNLGVRINDWELTCTCYEFMRKEWNKGSSFLQNYNGLSSREYEELFVQTADNVANSIGILQDCRSCLTKKGSVMSISVNVRKGFMTWKYKSDIDVEQQYDFKVSADYFKKLDWCFVFGGVGCSCGNNCCRYSIELTS